MKGEINSNTIIVGDFNTPLIPMDRSTKQKINRGDSVVFEIASKYCISYSFIDYEGYFISSKGFLPIVVDIMVI